MWRQGGGNWGGWQSNWPVWHPNHMAHSFNGSHNSYPWSYQAGPSVRNFSEMSQFQEAYQSDRHGNPSFSEDYQFARSHQFNGPPPRRSRRWDNPHKVPGRQNPSGQQRSALESAPSSEKLQEQKESVHCTGSKGREQEKKSNNSEGLISNTPSSEKEQAKLDVQPEHRSRMSGNVASTGAPKDKEQSSNKTFLPTASERFEKRHPTSNFATSTFGGNNSVVEAHNVSKNAVNPVRISVTRSNSNLRGGTNAGRLPFSKRWNSPRLKDHESDREDESNEINHWLQITKNKEAVLDRDCGNPSKNPLPGSEEARNNAIKEATNRLKQALKQKKNIKLNELLSSGDESKVENVGNGKTSSCLKNLADLQLDATDMREIGRANTEKTICAADENSDDDIVEVERPPSPMHPIIDLDNSPIKDNNFPKQSIQTCSTNVSVNPSSKSKNIVESEQESQQTNDHSVVEVGADNSLSEVPQNLIWRERPAEMTNAVAVTERFVMSNDTCSERDRQTETESQIVLSLSSKQVKINEGKDATPASDRCESEIGSSYTSAVDKFSGAEAMLEDREIELSRVPNPSESKDKASNAVSPSTFVGSLCNLGNKGLRTSPISPTSKEFQRRRRSSSSSTCELMSPQTSFTSSRTVTRLQSHCTSSDLGSTCLITSIDHDSHQKKIISDLKKISQNKIRDLVNNPRSGKLDFAMKELMKQHRATLSRKTRDVAEKLIPTEHLNPKSSELPPDDTTFLADFAIDWSSLPGELISSLGDLFQAEICSTNLELQSSSNLCMLTDEIPATPSCIQVDSVNVIDPALNVTNVGKEKQHEKSESVGQARIRVRPFARENLPSPVSICEVELPQSPITISNSDRVEPQTCDEPNTESLVDSNKVNATSNFHECGPHAAGPWIGTDHLQGMCDLESGQTPQKNHPALMNNQTQGQRVFPSYCNPVRKSSHRISSQEDGNFEGNTLELSNALPNSNSSEDIQEISITHASSTEVDKNVHRRVPECVGRKIQTKRLIHLEERSWFEDCPSGRNHSNPPIMTASNVNDQSQILNYQVDRNVEVINALRQNEAGSVSSIPTHEDSHSNQNSYGNSEINRNTYENFPIQDGLTSIFPSDNQCLSMLPVLMMTVPANGVSGTVSSLTPSEMKIRITEIDAELQNLVQERFVLSQALKASQGFQESDIMDLNRNNSHQIRSSGSEAERYQDKLVAANDLVVPQDRCTLIQQNHTAIDNQRSNASQTTGRKRQHDITSEKALEPVTKKSKNSEQTVKKIKKSKLCVKKVKKSRPRACKAVSSTSKKLQKDKHTKDVELIVLDDDINDKSLKKNIKCLKDYLAQKLCYQTYKEFEGNIVDIKVDGQGNIFAASYLGRVYSFTHGKGNKYALQAEFQTENSVGITCLEILGSARLYTGGADGVLNVFTIPKVKCQGKIENPYCTVNMLSSIHCMELNWNVLYVGTKAGSVVPFDANKETSGVSWNLGGYPVLAMKSCLEGPRRVLIVACRHQPISIRDATSGLLLRSLGGSDWTVYSLVLHKNLVYCGANTDNISVFDFQSGKLKYTIKAGKGVIDMKVIKSFLFCGCYDGKIYVFNLETNALLGSIDGPGKMILCLLIFGKKILCSSKDSGLVFYSISKNMWRVFLGTHN